ncbi:MAG TPA: DUF721 domain-containing protein [Bacteroidota bacterium]|nr:DUF721 domain-containing protein [Bacteroidota bacterium]
MNEHSPRPIGNALSETLQTLGLEKKIREYELLAKWGDIVGDQIARVTSAQRIEGGTLFVAVTGAVWRNELVFLKMTLLEKIRQAFPDEIVKDIIFR